MTKIVVRILFLCAAIILSGKCYAQKTLRFANLFNNGMVMQRGAKIPVWGTATPGSVVCVTINGKAFRATTAENGSWQVQLPSMKAGGPYEMTASSSGEKVVIGNILIGDVYLCSGQSNMELPIRRCMDNKVIAKLSKSYTNHNIRYLKAPHQFNYVSPNDDMRFNPWQDITPDNCAEVGGLCYFFAKQMQEKSGVPVGIINSSVGGTPVESWMPSGVLAMYEGYGEELKKLKYHQTNWPDSIARLEREAASRWEMTMAREDSIVNRWKTPGYDFSAWKEVEMFSDWGKAGNGSYWFRNTVTLPSTSAGKEGIIRVGAMRDADSVFVNGRFVGYTSYQYPPRIYKIPSGVLREGENEIVVHLMSQHDTGRFVEEKLYQVEVGRQIYPLSEKWQMQIGKIMPERPSDTYFVAGYTGLYNAMIAPLRNFPIKGMVWYQGEANLDHPSNYAELFEGMVGAWRKQWGKDFPVVVVQLPSYMEHHEEPFNSGWTEIRWQQYLAAKSLKKAALVPTLDTGERTDIHPQEKDVIGQRVANAMQALLEGKSLVAVEGPKPLKVKTINDKAVVTFDSPLSLKIGTKLRCFATAVAGCYVWANAVVVSSTQVEMTVPTARPFFIRYGWDDFVDAQLFNMQGTPSPQFQIEIK